MPPQSQTQIQVAEAQYTSVVAELYEKLLDLNIPMFSVAEQSQELMKLRDGLLDAYGAAEAPAVAAAVARTKPPKKAKPAQPKKERGATFGPDVAGQFKMKLVEVAAKRAGRTSTREDLVFEYLEEDKTYVATLTSALLQGGPYTGAAPEVTKRGSEQAACEVAMKAEFPEVFAQMEALGAGPDRGQKRKSDEDPVILNGKSRLAHVLALLLERSCTKDDIVYDMEHGHAGFVSTVIIPYKGVKRFKGPPATSRKDAESSAAEVCMEALKQPIAAAVAEHKAKKLKKKEEDKEKLAAKRAAQEAEAEAAGK